MLLGRTTELKQLNHYFSQEENSLVIVYGHIGVGISGLIDEFLKEKESYRYCAEPASEREQAFLWSKELKSQGEKIDQYPDFSMIFSTFVSPNEGKQVLVIEDFQYMIKAGTSFMDSLVQFLDNRWNQKQTMIILTSSAIGWVENSLVTKIGKHAFKINEFMKIKPLSFLDLVCYFDGWSTKDCIMAYGILGGFPKYWQYFDKSISVEENIRKNILNRNSYLFAEGRRTLLHELREENVYCTILEALAAGKNKLNDLYLHTGFSRAKISVYLKNLIQLEIVEKVYSYETGGWENAQKGIYRICHPLIHFTFKYMYQNTTKLNQTACISEIADAIMDDQSSYYGRYFKNVCNEYLQILNKRSMLAFQFDKCGEWVGKAGNIDIIAQNGKGTTLVGMCNWEKPCLTYADYEWFMFCVKEAKLKPQYIYLFSVGGFDRQIVEVADKQKDSIMLVDMNTL